ncbi:ATP-binding protein [Streptomyces cyaneus]|uniref:ATP-binding protein n=1 Tax=Streptomyces cyaneus TaxID=1904 RepID=UPI003CCC5CBB
MCPSTPRSSGPARSSSITSLNTGPSRSHAWAASWSAAAEGRLGQLHTDRTLRIEVTDARGDRIPQVRDAVGADAESGRGLLIVAAYADRWGVDEAPANCKTVWAELAPDRGES